MDGFLCPRMSLTVFAKSRPEEEDMKIGLLGASFDTGNLGVSALAESSIKLILNRWPEAEVTIIGSAYEPQQHHLFLMGKKVLVETVPIRFSRNILIPFHFLQFAFYGFLARLLPISWFKKHFAHRNPYFRILYEVDVALDVTGGDSFTDIYGMKRFLLGFLRKWLMILLGKQFILLPQTYGPFRRRLTRMLARHVMKHAHTVYSRDRAGVEYARELLNIHNENKKVRFAPDVAFILDAREPENIDPGLPNDVRTEDSILVGMNISGLLFSGGYTRDNMFGLRANYQELVYDIIELLLKHERVVVLLIPHVFPPKGLEVESDPDACGQVYDKMHAEYPDRVFLVQGVYNQNEIKYLIGKCDFFIGSRMHSCIAALSQCVSTVGLAYSKKFLGVFESIDAEESVIDVRSAETEEILSTIDEAFEQRQETANRLKATIPEIQRQLLRVFDHIS